jgi:hypothetical protein
MLTATGAQPPETQVQFIAAIIKEMRQLAKAKWAEKWKEETKGRHSYRLTSAPTKKILALHSGLPKAMSSIGIQLRTGKIGLGDFLFGRKVPGFDTPECSCGRGNQTVQHVLLACPRWTEERWRAFGSFRQRDMAVLLGKPKEFRASITFILETGLLGQFKSYMEKLKTI